MMPRNINPKQVSFGKQARESFLKGVHLLADAVGATLGPGGRNVAIDRLGDVQITKDGVTVARAIALLEDPYEDMGLQLVKSVASKTGDSTGDGTTTATVLARALLQEGMFEEYENVNYNVTQVREGMLDALKFVTQHVKSQAIPCDSIEMVRQVSTISGNGDEEIGNLMVEAFKEQGSDTVVTIEESKSPQSSVDRVNGFRYDEGYLSPYLVTNNRHMKAELDNPYILIVDHKLQGPHELLELLNTLVPTGRPLLIIGDQFDNSVTEFLAINNTQKVMKLAATKFPTNFPEDNQYLAQDIAILTGATVISPQNGLDLRRATLEHLGSAKKIVVTRNHTTIVEGTGDKEEVKRRIEQLKDAKEKLEEPRLKSQLLRRISLLRGGVTTIKAGGATEAEMSEKKDRLDDAAAAIYSAYKGGVVAGGGVALLKAQTAFQKHCMAQLKEEDMSMGTFESSFSRGQDIVYQALSEPIHKILDNVDAYDGKLVEKIAKSRKNIGFNARTKELADMFVAGVVDPAEVVIAALTNAVSVASLILTTEVAITDKQEEKQDV